jgi:hypothetical protein
VEQHREAALSKASGFFQGSVSRVICGKYIQARIPVQDIVSQGSWIARQPHSWHSCGFKMLTWASSHYSKVAINGDSRADF